MDVTRILAELDQEISRLQQIRTALAGASAPTEKPRRGRPKGSGNKTVSGPAKKAGKKRQLSPEGRKAIADAMKRRWAERKKSQG